jgi:hypothetical protein
MLGSLAAVQRIFEDDHIVLRIYPDQQASAAVGE